MGRACLMVLLVASSLSTGCQSAPACPIHARTDASRALADHASRQAGWRSIKAEARVTQWGRSGRIRGTVLMFLERPSRVRFDVMTQLGPAAVLTSDGEQFQLSDFRKGVFLQGPTCPRNIARLIGISVGAEDILKVLTGDTPVIASSDRSIECRDGLYVVILVAADRTKQELAFSVHGDDLDKAPAEQRLTLRHSIEVGPDGKTRWQVSYEDYVDLEGHSFPKTVRFVDRVNDADTVVRVRSISLNPEVPDEAFHQEPVPNMATELASCS